MQKLKMIWDKFDPDCSLRISVLPCHRRHADEDFQGWCHGAMLTDLTLPALEIWRMYQGHADLENRIKELKANFGLGSFVLRDFWVTEAVPGATKLAVARKR